MPLHDYSCDTCGTVEEFYYPIQESPAPTAVCGCGAQMRRRFAIPATPVSFQPHYNQSVGAYVRNEAEFRDHLKRGSEEMSQRMGGLPVNYEPVPLAEVARDESHLEATKKARRDAGQDEAKRTFH